MPGPESIKEVFRNEIRDYLQSPEGLAIIDQRAEQKLQAMKSEQSFTRKQMAEMYQVSQQTIDRLTDEELEDKGFKRIRVGVSVRFERIYNQIHK